MQQSSGWQQYNSLTLESAIKKNKIEVAGKGFAGKWWCVK
jgi:hypothetical protein